MENSVDDIKAKNTEKEEKYAATAEELRQEGYGRVTVKGLWVGARGIFSSDGQSFLKSLGFSKNDLSEIICLTLKFSYSMLQMFFH